jgi:hypothetical protein
LCSSSKSPLFFFICSPTCNNPFNHLRSPKRCVVEPDHVNKSARHSIHNLRREHAYFPRVSQFGHLTELLDWENVIWCHLPIQLGCKIATLRHKHCCASECCAESPQSPLLRWTSIGERQGRLSSKFAVSSAPQIVCSRQIHVDSIISSRSAVDPSPIVQL